MENMLRNAVKTLASITAAASMLAQYDPQSLKIAKSNPGSSAGQVRN